MDTFESKHLIKKGDQPINAEYRCFDCRAMFKGYAETGSWIASCPECGIGMLLVYDIDGKSFNRGYFGEE